MKVRCPTCKRQVQWSAQSPYRPFCSERCRLIDLGAWFEEKHAIPADAPVEAELGDPSYSANDASHERSPD